MTIAKRYINTTYLIHEFSDSEEYSDLNLAEIASGDLKKHMKEYAENHSKNVTVFPFLSCEGKNLRIDIYFWGLDYEDKYSYERFTIIPNKMLEIDREIELLTRCRDRSLYISDIDYLEFFADCQRYFPEIHLKITPAKFGEKETQKIGKLIEQLYYSLHHSIAETFYKADLCNIAWRLADVCDLNLQGSTPGEILGNIPLKALRFIDNNKFLINFFKTEERKSEFLTIFNTYSAIAGWNGKSRVSEMQWEYIEQTEKFRLPFSKKIYEYLTYSADISDCEACIRQLCLAEKLKEYNISYDFDPLPDDPFSSVETIELLLSDEDNINRKIQKVAEKEFEGEYGEYVFSVPTSVASFIAEALAQNNCILSYIRKVINKDCYIVFMRKKENPDKSFITVELTKDYYIVQARGKNNRNLTLRELKGLERYSRAMCISYDPRILVDEVVYKGSFAYKRYIDEYVNKMMSMG